MQEQDIDYKALAEQLASKVIEMQEEKKPKEHTVQIGMDNYYVIKFVDPHDALLYAGDNCYEIGTTRPTHRIIAISNELDALKASQVLAHELVHALIHETLIETPEVFTEEQVCKMFQMWNTFIHNIIHKVVK